MGTSLLIVRTNEVYSDATQQEDRVIFMSEFIAMPNRKDACLRLVLAYEADEDSSHEKEEPVHWCSDGRVPHLPA